MSAYSWHRGAATRRRDHTTDVPHILLIQRLRAPFQGAWAFPGGFVEENEDLLDAAIRETVEETGFIVDKNDPSLRQIGAFGAPQRDPRGWTVSVAYTVVGTFRAQAISAQDDAQAVGWFPISALPKLAFDHTDMLAAALVRPTC